MADAYQGSEDQVDATLGALLHSVLDATADGLLVVDLEGKIRLTNARFSEVWRISPELLQPGDHNVPLQSVLDQVPDPASFLARIRELYESPSAESLDVIRLRDGRVLERYSKPHVHRRRGGRPGVELPRHHRPRVGGRRAADQRGALPDAGGAAAGGHLPRLRRQRGLALPEPQRGADPGAPERAPGDPGGLVFDGPPRGPRRVHGRHRALRRGGHAVPGHVPRGARPTVA